MLGKNIVLDVYSGAVHLVDETAFDLIREFETAPRKTLVETVAKRYAERVSASEVDECYDEILALKNAGKLFSEDTFRPLAGTLKERKKGVIKALCLHVSHTCNLNCSYCFASQGKYHGDRAVMTLDVGKRALDFLIAHSGSQKNLEVDFCGGEPLMNFDMIRDLVAFARQREKECGKHFRFTLTTNGVLVDQKVIDFANREMHNVVLSLDGRRDVHDRFRKDLAGNGSWERIVPKFQDFVRQRGGKNYYIRGTFTHYNPDFLRDIQTMLDLGFDQISMEPVVCAPSDPCALTEEDLTVVLDQYEKLAKLMDDRRRAGKPFTFYHYMIDLKGGPCIYKRLSGCGSGTEYMAVTPWGDLYPCHQFVGEDAFLLGNIRDGVTNGNVQKDFFNCSVYSRKDCENCWAKLYCSGGCAANAFHATGSVNGIYESGCRLFQKRMECAIALEALKEESRSC